ncbi:14 kDa proline-rich protein DC2.15-like [Malania oleifera]|uniref:14 kDa proline-rich protein DC2.15-like n=1 Tax=Malania oleifera TaxID=397392 RepID=UPI0025AE3F27|nr:14 kDa proline-rich protein DC2.15-like [Malania oleifera]
MRMGSERSSASAALFLALNLLFFALASGCNTCIGNPGTTTPNPSQNSNPTPSSKRSCPRDALKLGVCARLLGGPIGAVVGNPPDTPCCSLLQGLVDLEAALCLCTAIKANILGINLNIPISLSLLINTCGKKLPSDFQCS